MARRGKGMVVLDQLRWDTEPQNARKAARYAGSLLAALGGDFTPRLGVTIECEHMTPQPDMPFFHNYGTHVALACNGYVQDADRGGRRGPVHDGSDRVGQQGRGGLSAGGQFASTASRSARCN